MASKKSLRLRKARNVIRGLVGRGVKMNFDKSSPFTQEQAERKRIDGLAGLGEGRGKGSK